MSPYILFVFVLTLPMPATCSNRGGCKDIFDNFSSCSDFIEGRCNNPSPLCCHNVNNLNAIAGEEGPMRICKCVEYFDKARHPFDVSHIQKLLLKCNTHLRFPISEPMDCSRSRVDEESSSDIRRRILAETRYISYGALEADRVPCSTRGSSYYNCRYHQQANPYTRGCTRITYCARENH